MADFEVRIVTPGAGALAPIDNRLSGMVASATRLRALLAAAFAAAGVATALRAFNTLGTSITLIDRRLRLTTETTRELNEVYEGLFDAAQDTRGELETLAGVYSRIARATEQLGVSNERVIAITETLQQFGTIAGATSQEAANSLRQFAQGLASGRLAGDELRSVLENMPPLARALADELGVAVGALRDLGAQGRITAGVAVRAVESVRAETEETFRQLPATADEAFTQIGTSITGVARIIEQETAVYRTFVETLQGIAAFLNDIGSSIAGDPLAAEERQARLAEFRETGLPAGFDPSGEINIQEIRELVRQLGEVRRDLVEEFNVVEQTLQEDARLSGPLDVLQNGIGEVEDRILSLNRLLAILTVNQESWNRSVQGSPIHFLTETTEALGRATGDAAEELQILTGGFTDAEQAALALVARREDLFAIGFEAALATPEVQALVRAFQMLADAREEERRAEAREDILEGFTSRAQLQNRLIGLTEDEAEVERSLFRLKQQAAAADVQLTDTELDNARRLIEANQEKANSYSLIEQQARAVTSNIEDAIHELVTTGRADFSSLVNGIFSDLARLTIRQNITRPLFNALTGGGGLGSLFGFGGAQFGADFVVPGTGGPDTRLLALPVTPGERVQVTPEGQRNATSGGRNTYNFVFPNATAPEDQIRDGAAILRREARRGLGA